MFTVIARYWVYPDGSKEGPHEAVFSVDCQDEDNAIQVAISVGTQGLLVRRSPTTEGRFVPAKDVISIVWLEKRVN